VKKDTENKPKSEEKLNLQQPSTLRTAHIFILFQISNKGTNCHWYAAKNTYKIHYYTEKINIKVIKCVCDMCVRITVYNCRTQHSTEQLW